MVSIEDLTGAAFQAESGGHTFEISGIDDTGAAVELSGAVAGVFRRPDNADIALTGSASDGLVSVTLSEDCYAVPGRFGLTIFVTSDSQKVAVYACVGTVAVSSTGNVAGDTPASVEDLLDAIDAAIADLNTAIGSIPADYSQFMAAIAPAYSSSALYAVGSYAWYDGKLYVCIVPITSGETWTAAHWKKCTLGVDVFDISTLIENTNPVLSIPITWEQGSLNNSGAEIASESTRYRTQFIHAPLSQDIVLSLPRYINVYGYRYDCDKNFIGFVTGGWLGASSDNQDGIVKITNDGTAFYRFVMRAKTLYAGTERAITTRDTSNSVAFIETKADVSNKAEAINFTVGSIVDYYNLTNSDISNRAVCSFIPVRGVCALFTIPSGHQAYVYQYDSNYQYLQENGWSSGHFARGLNDACKFLRLVIKTDAGSSAPTLSTLKNGVSIVFKDDIERVNINPIITGNALLAHRGYAVTAPENTIPAIELAAENGYKMVEVDLQFTSDGVCVLLHDNTIDRTSNGTGNIYDMTYAQALEYDFGSWKSAEYAGTKIPTLKEALLCCKYYGMCAQLDIADTNKTNITEANLQTMIDVIMECGMQGNVNICAENDRARAVSYLKQGLIICIGVGDTEGKFNARKDIAKMCSLLIGSNSTGTATEAMLKRCHDNYMPYQIWTVDVANTAKDYFRAGYDWIITNSLKPSDLT
jgi:glycerophosphoryl diester phosphodiesterase